MGYQALVDVVVLLHGLFIVFVVLGALLVLWRPRVAWVHLPCVAWGILLELNQWVCPLTPLELWLRKAAGSTGYSGGFIDHYLGPVIYPVGLGSRAQWALAALLFTINVGLYGMVWRRWRGPGAARRRRRGSSSAGKSCYLVVLAVLAAPFSASSTEARVKTTLTHLELLHWAIERHQENTGELPGDLLHLGTIARLYAPGVTIQQGAPIDAWGNRYIYHLLEPGSQPPYEIYSIGKNERDESGDGDDVASRSSIDVQFYPELYRPALQIFPILFLVALVPIVWAVMRAAKRAAG
jgi:hypothetical protein